MAAANSKEVPASGLLTKDIVVPRESWRETASKWIAALIIASLLAWSWSPAEMFRWTSLISDAGNMAQFASGFLEPNFRDLDIYLQDMVVTIQIAVWGTFLAVALGIPFAILSSTNICPIWIVQPVRRLMDACRAINEIVFALLFVVAVGLGPFAGVMALFIHNLGIVAKLFSESVEAIDPRPVEGIRATGASKLQEIIFGVVPQVIPHWISFALYRFETNVRSATVLGIVGAGGIGQLLWENIRSFAYSETAAMMIIIILSITLIDILSQRLRKWAV